MNQTQSDTNNMYNCYPHQVINRLKRYVFQKLNSQLKVHLLTLCVSAWKFSLVAEVTVLPRTFSFIRPFVCSSFVSSFHSFSVNCSLDVHTAHCATVLNPSRIYTEFKGIWLDVPKTEDRVICSICPWHRISFKKKKERQNSSQMNQLECRFHNDQSF